MTMPYGMLCRVRRVILCSDRYIDRIFKDCRVPSSMKVYLSTQTNAAMMRKPFENCRSIWFAGDGLMNVMCKCSELLIQYSFIFH